MKKLKFLSLFIIMAMLAGCAAETANNSATATLSGTQAVQTGTASASVSANSTSTSEMQNTPTQGQATPAPTAGNTTAVTSKPTVAPSKSPVSEVGAENGILNYITLFGEGVIQIDDYILLSPS